MASPPPACAHSLEARSTAIRCRCVLADTVEHRSSYGTSVRSCGQSVITVRVLCVRSRFM
ncbi:unnamed protein product [Staurois parvus]|uniref:Uncharacterized protein n=1 Tax=Staurois parvus TaxID=386267 RepID=A0ABN9BX74_9NEOB|nr:unnamed protein product [Staurois parvus]